MATKRTSTGSEPFASLPLLTPALPEQRDRRGSRDDSASQLFARIQKGEVERRSFRERRATRRVAVGLDLEARAGTEVLAQRTHDLSTFGLSIREGAAMEKGTTLALRLFLPDDPSSPLALNAVVVGPFDEQGGVRVKFVDLPMAAVRRIHRLVK